VRYCRTQAPDALKVEQLEAQLERANQQVESLKAQLNSVKSSTTWKCGRAVTALPRGLKRAAARKQK
jgi:prefoldin subunit 5